jgi:hypothetical protein
MYLAVRGGEKWCLLGSRKNFHFTCLEVTSNVEYWNDITEDQYLRLDYVWQYFDNFCDSWISYSPDLQLKINQSYNKRDDILIFEFEGINHCLEFQFMTDALSTSSDEDQLLAVRRLPPTYKTPVKNGCRIDYQWQFEVERKSWKNFSYEFNNVLNQSFSQDQKEVTVQVTVGGTKTKRIVDLKNLKQNDGKTVTSIRYLVPVDPSKWSFYDLKFNYKNDIPRQNYLWQYYDEVHHKWRDYDSKACEILNGTETIKFYLCLGDKKKYQIDLKNMIQVNCKTKYKRAIRALTSTV